MREDRYTLASRDYTVGVSNKGLQRLGISWNWNEVQTAAEVGECWRRRGAQCVMIHSEPWTKDRDSGPTVTVDSEMTASTAEMRNHNP